MRVTLLDSPTKQTPVLAAVENSSALTSAWLGMRGPGTASPQLSPPPRAPSSPPLSRAVAADDKILAKTTHSTCVDDLRSVTPTSGATAEAHL